MGMFSTFAENLRNHYSFTIKYKNESLFMKMIGFILFFNKDFMKSFVTTIGSTIYFPSKDFVESNQIPSMITLVHELVHVAQAKKHGRILFFLMYLFPQCLAVFSLLAILAFVWTPFLCALIFLVFTAPIPAPFRKNFELEAYYMSLQMYYLDMKRMNRPDEEIQRNLFIWLLDLNLHSFRGPNYYFMWPFGVVKELGNRVKEIRERDISDTDETYSLVKELYLKSVSPYEL